MTVMLTLTHDLPAGTYTIQITGKEPPPGEIPVPAVVAYSQNDPRWRDAVYSDGATFGRLGCLVVGVTMIASLVYDNLTPPEVAERLREARAFNGAYLGRPYRIPDALPALEWGGVEHWRDKPADISSLARELGAYGATICEVKWNPRLPINYKDSNGNTRWNQHFIVVEAIVDDDVAIVDPWDGKRRLLSDSSYRLPGWDVERTLYGMRMVRPEL